MVGDDDSGGVGRFASMEMVFENLGLLCYCDRNVSPAPFSVSEIIRAFISSDYFSPSQCDLKVCLGL